MIFNTNTLVLTANQRLAQVIRQKYDQEQARLKIWESPQVIPFQSWLSAIWQTQDFDFDIVLAPNQERELWAKIIGVSRRQLYPLLNVAKTTQLVQEAWQLLNNWQISLADLKSATTSLETKQFIDWVEEFIACCQARHWVSTAAIPAKLQTAVIEGRLHLNQEIILAGFDELPPAQRALVQTLSQFTVVTELPPLQTSRAKLYQQSFSDVKQEITHMAHWAKLQLQKNPGSRIGCVAPNFTEHRTSIAQVFQQVFAEHPHAFNIASGDCLHSFAIIQAALQALDLNFAALLQSPYLCQHETDINFGAILDAECRKLGNFNLTLPALYSVIAKRQTDYPQQTWLTRLRNFAAIRVKTLESTELLPSQWVPHFVFELDALGWPGGRSLNSQEYQLISRWQELLSELKQLDEITGAITRQQALNCLRNLVDQTIFQAQSSSAAHIQVLGLLESSGFYFDTLWIMGMSQQNWPLPAKPNPFLPYSLQIARQTPHCSAERELHYALKITERLLHSAQSIWVSCSAAEPDQPAQFSRLIPRAQPADLNFSAESNPLIKMLASGCTEPLNELYGPKISATEKIHGGSGIFTQQAECPFRAFATYRLHATALATPELGISKKKHGILIHSTLEKLWKIFQNQQNLLSLNPEQLAEKISAVVDKVLATELIAAELPFAAIEKNRLLCALTDWFALEKQRPSFKILEQEAAHSVEIAGLRLHLQIDRVDELADGSRMLIDYKTSPTHIQAWLHERLLQPQLPLYTLSSGEHYFAGIAFAQLYAGKIGFNGLHAEYLDTDSYFPAGVISVADYKKDLTAPKTWEALLSRWRDILQKLAVDFQNGYASVDPADAGVPCKTCDLSTLCRIKL